MLEKQHRDCNFASKQSRTMCFSFLVVPRLILNHEHLNSNAGYNFVLWSERKRGALPNTWLETLRLLETSDVLLLRFFAISVNRSFVNYFVLLFYAPLLHGNILPWATFYFVFNLRQSYKRCVYFSPESIIYNNNNNIR